MSESEPLESKATPKRWWRAVPAQAAALWAAYWCVLLVTGQPIDLRPVYAGWQNLPVAALRAEPIGSLLDLHIQPPLWNVILGFAVAWSPFKATVTMGAVLLVSGCVLAASVAAILVRLRVPRPWALGITAAATMNTHLLVYAFNAGYDLPVAAMLGVLMWVVVGTKRPSTAWYGVAATATVIAMTRSLYHPVWVVIVVAIVGWELRSRLTRRQVVRGALIPIVCIGGWMTLNGVRHGTPTLSSWTGMNLLRSVYPTVSKADLREMHDKGEISGIAVAGPFRAYSAYEPYIGDCTPSSDDLGLTITTRPIPPKLRVPGRFYSEQAPNYNYECYIEAYRLAGSDAWAIMWRQPQDWVKARIWAADNWFEAPTVYEPKRSPLWRPTDFVTGVIYVRTPHPPLPEGWRAFDLWVHGSPQSAMVGLNWVLGFAAVIAYGVGVWRRRRVSGDAETAESAAEPVLTNETVGAPHTAPDTPKRKRPVEQTSTNADPSNGSAADDGARRTTELVDQTAQRSPVEASDALDTAQQSAVAGIDRALRRRTLIAVMGVTLAWTAFAGIFIELGEQGRFRAVTDPFVLSAVLVMNWRWYAPRLQRWWQRRSERRAPDAAA